MDDAYVKQPHRKDCDGQLYNTTIFDGIKAVAHVDKAGRLGNGGIVCHDYRCNMAWDGCPARVLVTERAVGAIARSVERRPVTKPDSEGIE